MKCGNCGEERTRRSMDWGSCGLFALTVLGFTCKDYPVAEISGPELRDEVTRRENLQETCHLETMAATNRTWTLRSNCSRYIGPRLWEVRQRILSSIIILFIKAYKLNSVTHFSHQTKRQSVAYFTEHFLSRGECFSSSTCKVSGLYLADSGFEFRPGK
jgi:hypothetical protein